ncbi:hypothetical protein MNQ96_01185 [Sphingopyxis granuli]|uniref:hypothetical protein n=1 Tax=Sphingopyxis granuli TaxID=267128 RepID=UPI001F5375DF|nr:hypothetical protein [Sphingopyxis granuli]UNK79739.1 hypothetical protein MNQ96_01185 [Sphingopyxis granuli]
MVARFGDRDAATFGAFVAAAFGLLAVAMLRRLPRVTRSASETGDQMPPSVTA